MAIVSDLCPALVLNPTILPIIRNALPLTSASTFALTVTVRGYLDLPLQEELLDQQ